MNWQLKKWCCCFYRIFTFIKSIIDGANCQCPTQDPGWVHPVNMLLLYVLLDIKTEDGLSHSPGQTGLLGYTNFSGTPPSQSLYSYSHTHGEFEFVSWHIHQSFVGLLCFGVTGWSVCRFLSLFWSLLCLLHHTCSPLAMVWALGVKSLPTPPLFSGSGPLSLFKTTTQHAYACFFFSQKEKKHSKNR